MKQSLGPYYTNKNKALKAGFSEARFYTELCKFCEPERATPIQIDLASAIALRSLLEEEYLKFHAMMEERRVAHG